jgi:hypothetical protein
VLEKLGQAGSPELPATAGQYHLCHRKSSLASSGRTIWSNVWPNRLS